MGERQAVFTATKKKDTDSARVLQELEQRTIKAIQVLKQVSEQGEKDSDRVSASKALLEQGLKYRAYFGEREKETDDSFLDFKLSPMNFEAYGM